MKAFWNSSQVPDATPLGGGRRDPGEILLCSSEGVLKLYRDFRYAKTARVNERKGGSV